MTEQVQKSDAELLAGFIRNTDETALDELVKRYGPMVFRTGYRVLHDVHEAEDVAQATFIVMVRKMDSLKTVSNLPAWLHSVAKNAAINALRTKIRRKTRERQSMENYSIQSHDGMDSLRELLHQSLDLELERLTGNQRQAVILRYLQGYSEKEAAEIAGCSVDALSRRANFGLIMLRKRLGKISPALGISMIPLLDSEAKAQVSPTLLSSIKSAVLSAKAGTLAVSGTTAYLMAKGVLEIMFWNKVKVVAVATIVVLAIPSTVIVINAREKPPASAEKIVNSIPPPAKNPVVSQAGQIPKDSKRHVAAKKRDYESEIKKRLLELAPQGEELESYRATLNILGEFFDEDQSSLIEWARKSCETQIWGGHLLPFIVEIWAEKDPKAAIEWIATQSEWITIRPGRETCYCGVARGWAKKDPTAAIEWIRTRPESEQGTLYYSALMGWGTKDPEAALKWAGQNPKLVHQHALAFVIGEYSNNNPEEAAKLALQISADNTADMPVNNPEAKKRALALALCKTFGYIANNWAMKDPKAAAEWAMQLSEGEARDTALVAVAKKWYLTEPNAALQWITQLPNRDNALSAIATASAINNPDAAIKLAMEIPEGNLREKTLMDVAKVWSMKDPTAAAQWAMQLPEGQLKDKVLAQVVGSLACEDPDAAENLTMQASDGKGKDEALSKRADSLSFKDPEKAAKLVMQIPEGDLRYNTLVGVAYNWTMKDPKAAAEWAVQLPEGQTKDKILLRMVEPLAYKDPDAALNLARQASKGKGKDEILFAVARGLASKDPERAAKLAMEMSDDKEQSIFGHKSMALMDVACYLNLKDSTKANEWVNNLKIPDPIRKIILQNMKKFKADNEAAKKQ